MADFTARLDLRVSTEQRARLDWLAGYLGVNPAAVARSWLDGNAVMDGVDLQATLHRLTMASPDDWSPELHVVVGSTKLQQAAHAALLERQAERG